MIEALLVLIFVWTIISFLDCIFKSCMFFPYISALERYGITVKPCYLHWYTTRFNRTICKWGHYKPQFLQKWFNCGAFVTCCLILPAIGVLFLSAYKVVSMKEKADFDDQLLIPVVPGVNLPLSHLFYYFIILSICSIFHEMGHAIVASREKLPVHGCGFFLMAVLPAAFIDLPEEQLKHLSTWQQLRVFSAGIWHNIVLVLVAVLLLLSNPMFFSPLYQQNVGVTVMNVIQNSGAGGPSGLTEGDHLIFANNCTVQDLNSWNLCLKQIAMQPQMGYCSNKDFILNEDTARDYGENKDCCGNSSVNLCFQYTDEKLRNPVCLPARKLLKKATFCMKSSDCSSSVPYACVTPMLYSDSVRLIEIKRHGKDVMLFYGTVSELYSTVFVSPWAARFWFLPVTFIEMYETFLKYVISFSGALALLNLVPCPSLDGQFLCKIIVHSLLRPVIPKVTIRTLIVQIINSCGCLLIAINIVFGVYKLQSL